MRLGALKNHNISISKYRTFDYKLPVHVNQYLFVYIRNYGSDKKMNKSSPSPSSCLEEIKHKVSLI